MDPGEWGGVLLKDEDADIVQYYWGGKLYESGDFFHAYEVLTEKNGYPSWNSAFEDTVKGLWNAVGVDELHSTAGLNEYEPVQTGLIDSNGDPLISPMGNAHNITDVVLSPMNYGNVKMQGCDMGLTHFISDKLIVAGNISWYGTTDFYNELTKKNDPINAPKWKWNASIKWNSDLGDIIVNFRHVDKFKWSDGLWAGDIGPYSIIDLFYTYNITDNLDFNLSALNLNNDRHKELIGGAVMGRQIIMRFTSTF
jgi:outer membrane receptor protein involved in Fe transport